MNTREWLLLVMAFIQWGHYCDTAFPRSNRGDPGGGAIVQLFRWRYEDIARECEQFLAPKGYGGVEVGPITDHWVVPGIPPRWNEPYFPISYNILSRSGDEKSFKEMVQRCNKAGIKVYVTVVLAYMTRDTDTLRGYGGSTAYENTSKYGVMYDASDFTQPQCFITNIYSLTQMRSCDWVYDRHLNHTKPKVRRTIRNFLNKLISFGVAGFSIDSTNRIHPDHLRAIFSRFRHLNTSHGFACESEPYIYQDYDRVSGMNDEVSNEYLPLGRLADYNYRYEINRAFSGYQLLSDLEKKIHYRTDLLPDDQALVFIDSQSAQQKFTPFRITYEWRDKLIAATAFMLAYPFGQSRIASSFYYTTLNDAPPIKDNVIAPVILDGDNCTGGWVCEHRWPEIYNMIKFRNVVRDAEVTNLWHDGNDNIAFGRGNKGFVLFNGDYWSYRDFSAVLQTGLPNGEYCDVITGTVQANKCTGKTISVDENGYAKFIRSHVQLGVTAIHIKARLK